MTRRQRKSGVSLLEVLFSIGVIAVGLVGIVALLPVALSQVGRGNVSDRVLRLGQNAEEEYFSRDMFRATQWVQPAVRPPASLAKTYVAKAPVLATDLVYCIDPQFVAANVNEPTVPANATINNRTIDPDTFPYAQDPTALSNAATEYPVIQRISLINNWAPSGVIPSPPQFEFIRPAHADAIFTLDDELTFEIPAEKTAPPNQVFGAAGKRQFEGTASWFATIAPVANLYGTSDTFYLSIVVCNRRDRTFSVAGNDESLVRIPEANFHIGGYRGGDVTLVATKMEELDIRNGQWLLLMRTWVRAAPLPKTPVVRWYRVIAVDNAPVKISASQWELDVTLDGPDWPVSTTQPETRAVIMRGVAEVFERTTRLEL